MTKFKVGDRVQFTKEARSAKWALWLPVGPFVVTNVNRWDQVELSYNDSPVSAEQGREFAGYWLEPTPAPALIDPQKHYRTRDGRDVLRILCTDAPGAYPVVALLASDYEAACVAIFTADGRYLDSGSSNTDLIEVPPAPKEYEGWVNVYTANYCRAGILVGDVCPTRGRADELADANRIACLHLKFHEGEGL